MKRKLLFVSLVAALSTVGYAYTLPHKDAASGTSGFIGHKLGNENFNSLAGAVNNLENQVSNNTATTTMNSELIGKLTNQMEQKADKEEFDNLKNEVSGNSQALGEMGQDIVDLEKNKADKEEFDNLKNEVSGNSQALGEMGQDIVNLDKNKVDKEEQKEIDRIQDDHISNVSQRLEHVKNEMTQMNGELKGEIIQQEEALNAETNAREEADKQLNNKIDQNKADQAVIDKKQDDALNAETNAREEADKKLAEQMDKFQGQMNNYGSRIDNLEKRVDNLDNKLNKGLSLMAAMNAVDFQDVAEGEMAIGAGVGHYGNAQSVAIGVAYAPTQNLNVNMKYSVTAGDVDSFAIGAGASYKFRVK